MSSNYSKGFRSVYKLNAHVVFVTKYRKPAINKERLKRLSNIFQDTLFKWDCSLNDFNAEVDYIELRKVTTTTDLLFYIAIHLLCFYVNKVSYTLMTLLHNVHKEKLYIV